MIDNNIRIMIQNEVNQALAVIAEKYGLDAPDVDIRRDRAGSFVRLMKVDMKAKTNAVRAKQPGTSSKFGGTPLEQALKRLGITKSINAKGEEIVAYKPSRPKYPFVFRGPKGGMWKGTEAQIKTRFGI